MGALEDVKFFLNLCLLFLGRILYNRPQYESAVIGKLNKEQTLQRETAKARRAE